VCGIAGFDSRGVNASVVANAMLKQMRRRGPDGSAWQAGGPWTLVHTRLAVVDLSDRVRYPMTNETGDLLLVFNGEIYNHQELRNKLIRSGHRFATQCDAEVLVHGYEEWGTGLFSRLSGMWAAALCDCKSGELLLTRDPLGIKPLVRTTRGRFAFGSDVFSLLVSGLAAGELDLAALNEFAAFHYVPHPFTGIAGVEQVEPGTLVRRMPDGVETVERWASRPFESPADAGSVSWEEAEDVLRGAVIRHLQADVPVGIHLSGGLDSALILHYAVEAGAHPTAFTIGFAGHGFYDETAAAAAMARRYGVPHETAAIDADFLSVIPEIGDAYDVPFGDPSAVATLALARMTRQTATVALSGTGGDDLFAGYYRHRAHHLRSAVAAIPRPLRQWLGRHSARRGGARGSVAKLGRSYLVRIAQASGTGPAEQYLSIVGGATTTDGLAAFIERPDLAAATAAVAERHRLSEAGGVWLDAIQRFEISTYLANDLLVKEDRASMAYGLESRVPMLDREMVGLAQRTPVEQRAGLTSGKRLLRELGRVRLGASFVRGRKRGFALPLEDLFSGSWRAGGIEWFSSSDSEVVDRAGVAELIRVGGGCANDIWALAALCAWEERVKRAGAAGATAAS
jgi:asparagine synthase (glutamine-hydrolysing)